MHELDIEIYSDHHADVAGCFLAASGVIVILDNTSQYRPKASSRGQRSFGCDSGTLDGMAVGRMLDGLVGRTGLRGLKDSA